jgi:hypothetical protein
MEALLLSLTLIVTWYLCQLQLHFAFFLPFPQHQELGSFTWVSHWADFFFLSLLTQAVTFFPT